MLYIRPLLLLLIYLLPGCHLSGKLSIQLLNYKNAGSENYDGGCCDSYLLCLDSCDNMFKLCLATTTATDLCSLYKGVTTATSSDSFSFSASLGNGIKNPFIYSFTRWQSLKFSIEVWDKDNLSADELVDNYSLIISNTPNSHLNTNTAYTQTMKGRRSTTNIKIKVYCDDYYLLPDCSTYCKSRDDDSGHYTCNYSNGTKVCLENWYGKDCLTYCKSRDDDEGHYVCDPLGRRVCLAGWTGSNCTHENISSSSVVTHNISPSPIITPSTRSVLITTGISSASTRTTASDKVSTVTGTFDSVSTGKATLDNVSTGTATLDNVSTGTASLDNVSTGTAPSDYIPMIWTTTAHRGSIWSTYGTSFVSRSSLQNHIVSTTSGTGPTVPTSIHTNPIYSTKFDTSPIVPSTSFDNVLTASTSSLQNQIVSTTSDTGPTVSTSIHTNPIYSTKFDTSPIVPSTSFDNVPTASASSINNCVVPTDSNSGTMMPTASSIVLDITTTVVLSSSGLQTTNEIFKSSRQNRPCLTSLSRTPTLVTPLGNDVSTSAVSMVTSTTLNVKTNLTGITMVTSSIASVISGSTTACPPSPQYSSSVLLKIGSCKHEDINALLDKISASINDKLLEKCNKDRIACNIPKCFSLQQGFQLVTRVLKEEETTFKLSLKAKLKGESEVFVHPEVLLEVVRSLIDNIEAASSCRLVTTTALTRNTRTPTPPDNTNNDVYIGIGATLLVVMVMMSVFLWQRFKRKRHNSLRVHPLDDRYCVKEADESLVESLDETFLLDDMKGQSWLKLEDKNSNQVQAYKDNL